jgi:ferredoxin-NADP reductase
MAESDAVVGDPIVARVVHTSIVVDQPGAQRVLKLMLNLNPGGRVFEAGSDVGFLAPGHGLPDGLRRYTIDSVGRVPFEDSIDITVYVRAHNAGGVSGSASVLMALSQGDAVPVYGPFSYPFYPPLGSRSNVIMIGAGCGMVPFRSLAHKIQARKLDWMGKVLMLEGDETGIDRLYLNRPAADQDQYFDATTQRAFEALKTRYSATASDDTASAAANREALWRLMGQGRVYVYLAGYRRIAEALDRSMTEHLRLAGRWQEAKAELVRTGHWLEFLYD